jgi:hypothetical protein
VLSQIAAHPGTSSGVIWASVLASAGVAAVVTLAIEWAAKPGLEARKERILERSRERRAALRALRRTAHLIGRVHQIGSGGIDPVYGDRMTRLAAEAEQLVTDANERIDVSAVLRYEWTRTLGAIYGVLMWIQSDTPATPKLWRMLDENAKRLELYLDLLGCPRWRWKRRRDLVRQLPVTQQLTAATEPG